MATPMGSGEDHTCVTCPVVVMCQPSAEEAGQIPSTQRVRIILPELLFLNFCIFFL